MSLREENEKRDRQLIKEASLFRTGFKAGLDAAVGAALSFIIEPQDNITEALINARIKSIIEAINKLRGD